MRVLSTWAIAVAIVFLAGCAAQPAAPYAADFAAVDSLKRAGLLKAAMGTAQPTDAAAKVNKISLRGATMVSASGSFATYVQEAMASDLKEAGLYDAAATRRVDITLLKNDVDISGFSEGRGSIEADFSLLSSDKLLFRKTYAANTTFESSFAGAVAIPKGRLEYASLVRALLGNVYRDPEFIKAMKTP